MLQNAKRMFIKKHLNQILQKNYNLTEILIIEILLILSCARNSIN